MFSPVIITPPKPINKFIYYCGKKFILEPIYDLFKTADTIYGVVEIYGEEYYISTLNNLKEFNTIYKGGTKLQKRQNRGGQSQNRIARLRLETVHIYLQLIS